MTSSLRFYLDEILLEVKVPANQRFIAGDEICMSKHWSDPLLGCGWYDEGYAVLTYASNVKYEDLVAKITDVVCKKLSQIFPDKNLSGFSLKHYHEYVSEEEHRDFADPVLKRLYANDLPGISEAFVKLVSAELGMNMGFKRELCGDDHWIILRINPPCSYAYNPPHKDIYEDFDANGSCPQMVNIWIPVVGVNSLAGLGLAPRSHLLPESKILRSFAGADMNDRSFSVNMIKSWDGSTSMLNIHPQPGSFLCFSSHLVHGLGINKNENITRVALELRLHKQ